MPSVQPSRRTLLGATAGVVFARRADASERLIEPTMRLARLASGVPEIALTFDACPGAFDWRIAETLVALGTPATIFVTGRWMRLNPSGLAYLLAHRDIFALENHGEWHIPPVLGPRRVFGLAAAGDLDTVRREVTRGAADIESAAGVTPRWYRAATGYYSRAAMETILDLGYGLAGYSLNADMGASLPSKAVEGRIARAVSGDVIVAHINQPRRSSGQGVVAGLRALQARGARFVRLDRLGPADVTID